jgi:hypothetical protein
MFAGGEDRRERRCRERGRKRKEDLKKLIPPKPS